jgi:hypothetical protein
MTTKIEENPSVALKSALKNGNRRYQHPARARVR